MKKRNITVFIFIIALISCARTHSTTPLLSKDTLCPSSPNCVSSDAKDIEHRVSPFKFSVEPMIAWRTVRELALELPRTRLVTERIDYLHIECRSSILGFVDDLELYFRPNEGIISVRSSSRIGYSDFGVNRRRVEELRTALSERGIVK